MHYVLDNKGKRVLHTHKHNH